VAFWSVLFTNKAVNIVAKTQSGQPELLFKGKHGTISATVYGPTIAFLWTKVDYFRWVPSTTEAVQWEKRLPDRETDQLHLERCVKDVRGWFKQRERRA
jgi:hypothetical protein